MNRLLVPAFIVLGFVSAAWAQSTGTTTTSDVTVLAGKSAQENAATFSGRSPGLWVRAALARHKSFIDSRVNGPRNGQQPELPSASTAASGSSSTSSLGSLGDLTGLIPGGLGSLGSLLGGTGGTGSGQDDLVQYIMDLVNQNNGTSGRSKSSNLKASEQTSAGGAIGRLPKAEQRLQDSSTTTTTTERKFTARLLESWSTTFFSALTLGFQSTDFIDLLKDALRPLIVPDTQADSGDGSSGDSSSGDGSGIEDADSNSGDGGSSI